MKVRKFNEHKLTLSDNIEKILQDKAKEYVSKFEWDSLKEEGIAYSAYLAGSRETFLSIKDSVNLSNEYHRLKKLKNKLKNKF